MTVMAGVTSGQLTTFLVQHGVCLTSGVPNTDSRVDELILSAQVVNISIQFPRTFI